MHDFRQVMIALRLALDECEMTPWRPGYIAPRMNNKAAVTANCIIRDLIDANRKD